ncbi:efflux transporter outer membrane subunit [Ectopseudomonas alcaliphila]|uniref:Efflux transporter outer membrane subunit n=1 Tax=Ectopseudomonas alcaliphila TaxID=101564 RepID=A0A1G6W4X2_9GAMM|nr:efflux transporter outer membrane subunit [Pseudomonas alcaliphila]MDX5991942.1 efflux transporter outer membrane subunit [Pseudomonas alcaliphila]SDD60277.1 efflux transporter, outer membrane factor (OMF) lipoprotein, NodT family [Pseudomonas alcaliphila]
MRLLLTLPLLVCLSACSLTPTLGRPAAPVAASFPVAAATSASTLPASALGWRAMFGDPRLQRLIDLALANNRDLRLAALNVEAARAMFNIQEAARLPSVSLDASHARERALAQGNSGESRREVNRQVAVNVGTSAFELDLFGRVRSLSDAALARYLASEQGRDAAQIALGGAVAEAYFAQRLADEQLQLTERTLTDWQQSLELARLLKQAEQNSSLDVAQAEGQVALAEADLEARRRALAQADNALQLLVGSELPGDLPAGLPLERQSVIAPLPAGLPADLLLNRPDLRQAEQVLVAANADIGAARAAFFPQISLTASFGYASTSLGGLFDPARQVWRFAPQISQPLFQGGRLRAELRLAKVRKSEAVAQYERAIQTAFREVADALAGTATFDRQIEAQLRAVSTAERRLALSDLRYCAGVEGRLELLDAQRQLQSARQALLELRREEIANRVALYKSLGGGLHERDAAEIAAVTTAQ